MSSYCRQRSTSKLSQGLIISHVSMQPSESEAKRQLNEGQESHFQSSQITPEDFSDTQTNALKKCQNVTPPARILCPSIHRPASIHQMCAAADLQPVSFHPCDWVAAEVLTCSLPAGARRGGNWRGGETEIGG